MRTELETVFNLLTEQMRIQRELLELSHEKLKAITGFDTEALNSVVKGELLLLSKMKSLEKRRLIVMAPAARLLALEGDDITISAIAERAETQEAVSFLNLKKEMTALVREQTELNEMNRRLLEAQIEYTDAILSIIVGNEDPINSLYDDSGLSSERPRSTGFFDGQV